MGPSPTTIGHSFGCTGLSANRRSGWRASEVAAAVQRLARLPRPASPRTPTDISLADWRSSAVFSERERAALAYVEEATRTKVVGDATFAELAKHFDEREIAELTLLNAIENFYNLLNLPLEVESDGLEALAAAEAAPA